jgi:hypothetical protein
VERAAGEESLKDQGDATIKDKLNPVTNLYGCPRFARTALTWVYDRRAKPILDPFNGEI